MILNWAPGSEDYFGLQTLIRTWVVGGGPATSPTQRGNIDFDQTRASVRHGIGGQFQMHDGGSSTANHIVTYDGAGNTHDSSVSISTLPTWITTAPATHSGTGTTGQVAYDSSGTGTV